MYIIWGGTAFSTTVTVVVLTKILSRTAITTEVATKIFFAGKSKGSGMPEHSLCNLYD